MLRHSGKKHSLRFHLSKPKGLPGHVLSLPGHVVSLPGHVVTWLHELYLVQKNLHIPAVVIFLGPREKCVGASSSSSMSPKY